MARAKKDTAHAAPFMHVRVKLPKSLHYSQPHGLGIVTEPDGTDATVLLLPTRHISLHTVTVPHRSVAKDKEGYWEAYTPE